jgi:hypothetical protein
MNCQKYHLAWVSGGVWLLEIKTPWHLQQCWKREWESTEKGNSEICDPFSNNSSLDVHDSFISFDDDSLFLENINNVGISLGSSSDTCFKCGSIFET